MKQQTYLLRFDSISHAEANIYAEELGDVLLDTSPDITVQRRRDNPLTLDFGSTLVLLLGTPAVVAAANAIGNWLQRHPSASITIETPEKKIIAQNITSKDAALLARSLLAHRQEENTK